MVVLPILALCARAAWADEPPPLTPIRGTGRARRDAALVVALEDYASIPDAPAAAADADAFTSFLVGNADVPAAAVVRLDNPTADQVRAAVASLKARVRKKGTAWVYVAGHGGVDADGARLILPADVSGVFAEVQGVPVAELAAVADGTHAARAVVVIDAGFGGVGRGGQELYAGNHFTVLSSFPAPKSALTTVWSATTTAEPSDLYAAAGHSMFTYLAVGALRGWADGAGGAATDGAVTLAEAQAWVSRTVRSIGGPGQKPTREARPAVADWRLGVRALEPGPTPEVLTALAAAESARRVKDATDSFLGGATAVWLQLPTGAPREAALRAFLVRFDAASIVVDGVEVPVTVPEVSDARAELDALARAASGGRKRKKGRTARAVAAPSAQVVSTAACDDLVRLEPSAMIGQLTNADMACLETRIAQDPQQTQRDKVSRVLMVNAEGRGDMASWMTLAARHLEVIDRSDPDLCYRYALLLARGEVEDAETALRWADYALENKHVWKGPTYTQRVYALLGLRADLAARLWRDAEQAYIDARSDDAEAEASRWRGSAKDYAREWLDYARVSAQPIEQPGVLCRSAAGNEQFCAEGAPPIDPEAPVAP